jgi:hypothetical protein
MQPYIKAMAWGFWRERRLHLVLFTAVVGAFSIFISQCYPVLEHYEAEYNITVFAMLVELLGIAGLMVIGFASPTMHLNIPGQLYSKPVSSRLLVGAYLGLAITAVVAMHLLTVLLYTFVGRIDWPVGVPLLGLVTIVLCAHAIYWSLSAVPLVCMTTYLIVVGFLFVWCQEHLSGAKATFAHILRYDLPYLALVGVCAVAISLHAVKHARCGERLSSVRFWERLRAWLVVSLPGRNRPLRTPQAAYFWVLCRTSGLALPVINLLFVVIAMILCVCCPDLPERVQGFMIGCAYANLFMLPFLGALVAHLGGKAESLPYNITTRPVSNRSILLTMLKAFLTSYAAGWIVYFVGVAVVGIWLAAVGQFHFSNDILNELNDLKLGFSIPGILLYLLCFWTAIGLTGSMALTGRRWPVVTLCITLCVVPTVMAFSAFLAWDTLQAVILGSLTWLFVLASVGGTLWAFIRMVQKHLMSPLLAGGLLGGYLLACVICMSLRFTFVNTPAETALLFGVLALPFAPLATAPLALAWNRHR